MSYVAKQQIQEAAAIDLYSYFMQTCPSEVVHLSGPNYCLKAHDSLVMSNGLWNWFSRGIGGRGALDFLMKTQGMRLPQAVTHLLGTPATTYVRWKSAEVPKGEVDLPLPSRDNNKLKAYLRKRGIDDEVADYCISQETLYEEQKYHNAVFLGYDNEGEVRYGALRGTISDFKSELKNSDKRFCFSIKPKIPNNILHVFESAIDALSYATILKMSAVNWEKYNYLSLGGRSPKALLQFLTDNPQVEYIELCLDNDEAGRLAMEKIVQTLDERLVVKLSPPPVGKDFNEFLCIEKGLAPFF